MGKLGDKISQLTGRRFYIDSARVDSMTTDYPIDMKETFRILGAGSLGLTGGILKTASWLHRFRGWGLPRKTLALLSESGDIVAPSKP